MISRREGFRNLGFVFRRADAADLHDGTTSYSRYNRTLSRLAEHYGASLEATVGAFVALSPNNDYMGNLRSTATLLDGYRRGVPYSALTISTYRACGARAWRCLEGEDFLSFTRPESKKTRAFYANILDPSDPRPVTIDGHMLGVYAGRYMTMKGAVRERFKYDDVADGIRALARLARAR